MKFLVGITGALTIASGKKLSPTDLELMINNITATAGQPARPAMPGMRALDDGQFERYFVGYGCWCNFDIDGALSRAGRGKPTDDWDQNCKSLYDNYQCILADGAEYPDGASECEPWSVEYGEVQTSNADLIQQECARIAGKFGAQAVALGLDVLYGNYHGNNRQVEYNKCVEIACVVESTFIFNLANLLLDTNGSLTETNFDDTFQHSNPTFDSESVCVASQGVSDPERECCGVYPTRFPFKPLGGARECCADHVVRAAGTCMN